MKPERVFMEAAIEEARISAEQGDYAIGAVVVLNGEIIAKSGTLAQIRKNPVLHAEVAVIQNATKKLNSQYLEGCILYTTHEPCPMCAAAAVWARMKGIVFGVRNGDMKAHAAKSENPKYSWRLIDVSCREVLEKGKPALELAEGFMREECLRLFSLSR
ncbi:MAG: nucleoside deaminase [Candidatus Aenigmarchaeota archaeon]|nr:nucleoside deaminase [Candidatus Aenigmarchaeota archaeon]